MTVAPETDVESKMSLNMRASSVTVAIAATEDPVSQQEDVEIAEKMIESILIDLDLIYIETHESEIPWLKIFTKTPKKEFSECTSDEKVLIWKTLDIIEKLMLEYYRPEKINIASFGNMLPHVHWHIMARFKEDSYFPEPMWGPKQRDASLILPAYDKFIELLQERLQTLK